MNKQELKKEITTLSAISLLIGSVLGAGALMKPAAIFSFSGNYHLALLAWIMGAVLCILGGLSLCELGALFPRTGGIYVFLEEVYNEKIAFLFGWMMVILYGPMVIGAFAGYFGYIFCLLFSLPDDYLTLVSGFVLLFVLFINTLSVKKVGRIQTIITICKLIPFLLIIIFGIFKGNSNFLSSAPSQLPTQSFSLAVIATLFAYNGWSDIATLAGEMKNPGKVLPRTIIGGLIFLAIISILTSIVFFQVLSASELVALGSDSVSIVAQKIFGFYGGNLIAVGILVALFGSLNANTMILSRNIYVLGQRNLLPCSNFLAKIDEDTSSPVNACIVMIILSFIAFLLFDAEKLSTIIIFALWGFLALTFYAVILARKKFPLMPRPYKVPLYPFVPILAILGSLYVFFGMFLNDTLNAIFATLLTLTGLPIYYFMQRKISIPTISKRYAILITGLLIMALIGISNHYVDRRPILTVAVEPSMPPIAFENSNGEIDGFDIEIIKKIANDNGYNVRFRITEFNNILKTVQKNLADVGIGEITITPERAEIVNFTKSYYSGGIALLVRNNANINSLEDLKGKTVATKAKTTSEEYLKQFKNIIQIEARDKISDLKDLFNQNKAEAILIDLPILESLLAEKSVSQARIINLNIVENYAFVYNLENKELGRKLNNSLEKMLENGEIESIKKKWLKKE